MGLRDSLRPAAKQAAFRALGTGPWLWAKLRRIARSGSLTILNLHRVAPHDDSSYPPLDPALFDALLVFAKRHFDILTFGELAASAASGRPRLILSFDDAYRDFHEYAAPIMARHGVLSNLNVIPACTDSGEPPLNVALQDFVGRAPAALLDSLDVPGFAWEGRPSAARYAFGGRLSAFLKVKPIAEQKELARHLLPQLRKDRSFAPTPMMTLDQLREVAQVHEIGGHSFEHANMAAESIDYVREDVERCRIWLREKLGVPLTIYAFPNGSYTDEQIDVLRGAGVEHILLVGEDFSRAGSDVHRRFTFDAASRAEMRFRATGAFKWPNRPRP